MCLLPLLLPPEQVFNHRQERQGADAGLGFKHVLTLQDALAALRQLDDLMADGNGLVPEVDRVPLAYPYRKRRKPIPILPSI